MFKSWLAHPLTRGVDLDDPRTTALRRRIICEKRFLRRIYQDWYEQLASAIPAGNGQVLELGSGAGFLRDRLPGIITSEVFATQGVDVILDGAALPIRDGALRALVMVDVLHHIGKPRQFFRDAGRCVHRDGVLVMIEPWVTAWSRFIYRNFHHEPFDPETPTWEFHSTGPLSGANGALPWILFERDRLQFEREFPEWRLRTIEPQMPFRYLVSGGVSLRGLMPDGSYRWCEEVERLLEPWKHTLAMFARIVLERTG
jgi:hypothetical protein